MAYTKAAYTKQPIVKVPRQNRPWSVLQSAVFQQVESGKTNIQVDAKAGSGKTATLVECTFRLPQDKTILCCAFNNSIKLELEARVKDGCVVQTMHSLGFTAIRKAFKFVNVDENKLRRHIDMFVDPDNMEFNELRQNLKKAVDFCKFNLATNSIQEIQNIVYQYNIENDSIDDNEFFSLISRIIDSTKRDTRTIDYADMIWLPIALKMSFPKYDYVFVDEAQDLNKCQIEIALSSVKSNGKVISFGDEWQAIYSFAGADSNSISNIVNRMKSVRLPLSISYRCPKNVILKAQEIVKDIEHAPNAKDGEVIYIDENNLLPTIKVGNVLLSRKNAPLISWCMKLLKNKIPANIVGRDIASGLISLIEKSKAKTIDKLIEFINKWKEKECAKLEKLQRDPSPIVDKAECIITLTEDCDSISEMKDCINKLFADTTSKGIVTLSSVHRFKGKESENVFVLGSTLRIGANKEESNLGYVAYTRSLDKLYIVN